MKKIIASVLLSVFTFNTLAMPLAQDNNILFEKHAIENSDNIIIDKTNESDILIDKSPVKYVEIVQNKTFENTKNIKLVPINEEEKRKSRVSQDPQIEKSNFEKIQQQNAKDADKNINPAQFGLGKAGEAVSESAEGYLNNLGGTSRVTLTGGDGFQTGSVDVLLPLGKFYDTDKHLFFIQLGARKSNLLSSSYRTTLNLGLGYRYFTDDNWMYGINSFYDQDITRGHQRIGFGAEAWTDNFKLSANTYRRLSNWKDSPDLINYQERPANGFDVRAEGSLPNYPQLGGKIMYEKYYGDEVGLFGESTRQKDPSAFTVGLTYKPVPLLTIGLDQRMGQDNKKDTKFNIGLNYEIGTPLSAQLDPKNVAKSNTLKLNKTALVERNNEIVLEYKIKPTGSIKLPENLNGNPLTTVTFPITVNTNVALSNFTWSGTASPFVQTYNNSSIGTITLPVYSTITLNTYTLQLSATDISGRTIQSNVLNIIVDGLTIKVTRSKAVANADGSDSVIFTATMIDKNQNPTPNQPITWAVRNATLVSSQPTTDANGEARAVITSLVSAIAEVDAVDPQTGTVVTESAQFAGNPISAIVSSITSSSPAIVANGSSTTTFSAVVVDSNNNTVPAGVTVNWVTTAGTLSSTTSTTSSNGIATITLTSSLISGAVSVNARGISTDTGKTGTVTFIADLSTGKTSGLSLTQSSIPANTISSSTISTTVLDANGNNVGAGTVVNWTTTSGTLSGTTSVTNPSGVASIILTSATSAGTATVNAKTVNDTSGHSINISFVADTTTARLKDITASSTSIIANSTSSSIISATIEDANNNIVGAGVTVNWNSTLGTLSGVTSVTNSSGIATITLTSGLISGTANVTGKGSVSDLGKTSSIIFTANAATSKVDTLNTASSTLIADGVNSTLLSAKITDANNNELGAGITVNWTTTAGTLSAITSTTNASGIATITITSSNTAGVATINAKASSGDTGKSSSITMVSNNATAKVDTITSSNTILVANGISSTVISALVSDANGNISSAGVPVTWSSTLGTLSGSTSVTNASGIASITLTSANASGTSTINAKANSSDIGKNTNITFTADSSTAKVSILNSSTSSGTAGISTPIILNATMVDANNNSLGSGVTVNWTSNLGSLSGATSVTNSSGIATITFTPGLIAGNATVSAKGIITDSGKSTTIVLESNSATAKVSNITSADNTIVANGTNTTILTATMVDANNNPLGSGVIVNWTSNLGTLSGLTSVTNASGIATITFTSSTNVGIATVRAKGISSDIGMTQNINLIANTATAKVSNITALVSNLIANGTNTTTLTATMVDANNNPLGSGVTVNWTSTLGTLSGSTSTTNSTGIATITFTSSTTSGTATVTAKGASPDIGMNTIIILTSDNTTAKVSNITSTLTSLTANGVTTTTVSATMVDANNNLLGSGVTVNWTSTLGTLSGTTSITNSSGIATITFTSGILSGTATVTAKGIVSDVGMVRNILLSSDNTTAKVSLINSSSSSILADGTSISSLTATMVDANNNLLASGVTVNWTTSLGVLSGTTSTTNSSGIATIVLTSGTTVGTAAVNAKGIASDIGKNTSISFIANFATAKVSAISSVDTTLIAGGEETLVTATVVDGNNNPLGAGITVTWQPTLGGIQGGSTSLTNTSGLATKTFLSGSLAGIASVNARGASPDIGMTQNITLIANSSTASVSTINPNNTTLVANGSTTTISALVKDENGNPMVSGVTINWTTTLGTLSTPTSLTNSSGIATITLNSGLATGNAVVQAKAGAIDSGKTTTILFTADTATAKINTLTSASSTLVATGLTNTVLTANVVDANNNVVGAGVTVNWTSTLGTLSGITSTTNASGVATMTLTSSTVSGTSIVTAKGIVSDGGKTANVIFTANSLTAKVDSVTASLSTIVATGTTTSVLSATVSDANNNIVGAGVTVNWVTNLGTLSGASSTTNASGVATITLTSETTSGTATVTAKGIVSDTGKTNNIVFAGNQTTAKIDTLNSNTFSVVAGSSTPIIITATMVDSNNNPLGAGVTVNWSSTGLGLPNFSTTTNSSGIATFTTTPPLAAGNFTVSAKGIVSDLGKTVTISVLADTATAKVSTLITNSNSIDADGLANAILTATMVDANNNPLAAGVTVNWTTTAGTLSSPTSTTNSSGVATATVTSSLIDETATITAKGVTSDAGKTVNVQFITAFVANLTISSNTTNYNLRNAAISAGWNGVKKLKATVTINSGIIVGTNSTSSYAFDTGTSFPTGTILTLINQGQIIGMGGNGGNYNGGGASGGPALLVQSPLTINNSGTIAGGGGGGGGSVTTGQTNVAAGGAGGGGGQGYGASLGGARDPSYFGAQYPQGQSGTGGNITAPGTGGTGISSGSYPRQYSTPYYATSGKAGNGGTLGNDGQASASGSGGSASPRAGGAAGSATIGNSNITWTSTGTRLGPLN